MNNRVPESLDWVNKRFHCCVGEIFEQLRLEVKEDVDKREEFRAATPNTSHYAFKFSSSERLFSAFVTGHQLQKAVIFELQEDFILVESNDPSAVRISPTVNNEGRCVLKINGRPEELERWQVRKMLLEDLFFTKY